MMPIITLQLCIEGKEIWTKVLGLLPRSIKVKSECRYEQTTLSSLEDVVAMVNPTQAANYAAGRVFRGFSLFCSLYSCLKFIA